MTEMTTMHAVDHHTAKHNGTWLHRGRGAPALLLRRKRSPVVARQYRDALQFCGTAYSWVWSALQRCAATSLRIVTAS